VRTERHEGCLLWRTVEPCFSTKSQRCRPLCRASSCACSKTVSSTAWEASVPQKVNVRVLVATNKDLERLMEQGKFRQDLYFRVSVVRLVLPPLRTEAKTSPCLCSTSCKRPLRRPAPLPIGRRVGVDQAL